MEALDATALEPDYAKMPGHWMLAAMGKRVLRPGGLALTRWMIQSLGITSLYHVVELAPGVGRTAQLLIEAGPASYVGIERDAAAATRTREQIRGGSDSVLITTAENTQLPDGCATVVCGEAFLTMQTEGAKERILKEVCRILQEGGRFGIHELGILSSDQALVNRIQRDLSTTIRVNAKPLRVEDWESLVKGGGLRIVSTRRVPMALLEIKRLIDDEGLFGTARIVSNLLRDGVALRRALEMRSVFRRYSKELCAISIVAEKS